MSFPHPQITINTRQNKANQVRVRSGEQRECSCTRIIVFVGVIGRRSTSTSCLSVISLHQLKWLLACLLVWTFESAVEGNHWWWEGWYCRWATRPTCTYTYGVDRKRSNMASPSTVALLCGYQAHARHMAWQDAKQTGERSEKHGGHEPWHGK